MYRVAVCEDEKNLREDLCAQCAALLSGLQMEHTVTPYSSAEELEAAFSAGAEFSLLCLDILMGGKSGMKLAQELRQRDDKTSILFITSSTEFLKDGYSFRPIQYLLKPVSREDLEQAIKTDLWLYHQPRNVTFRVAGRTFVLPAEDILCAESRDHGSVLHTTRTIHSLPAEPDAGVSAEGSLLPLSQQLHRKPLPYPQGQQPDNIPDRWKRSKHRTALYGAVSGPVRPVSQSKLK